MKEILLNQYLDASTEIGENINFVQGAGGNSSYKEGDNLYIKASGYKLKDSNKKNIFVKVNISKTLNQLNNLNPIKGAWDESKFLRPSIETTMHMLMPQKYVFHVHCLNTISWVVQKNFKERFINLFSDQNFLVIKYVKPGKNLTQEIKKQINQNNFPEILFLSNHGVVIGANNLNEVLYKINLVSDRLKVQTNNKSKGDLLKLKNICKNTSYKPSRFNRAHNIAFDTRSIEIAISGSMYPDHVVFLGTKTITAETNAEILQISKSNSLMKLPLIIVPKCGIIIPKDSSFEAEEMVLALSLIIEKIPKDRVINYLTKKEEAELINWKEEHYRMKLNNVL